MKTIYYAGLTKEGNWIHMIDPTSDEYVKVVEMKYNPLSLKEIEEKYGLKILEYKNDENDF